VRNGFRIYDTHAHLGAARHSGRECSAAEMLANMDRHGVERAMLIPFPVVEDCRAAHDLIAQAVREHPDRFRGAACMDPFAPLEEFRDEIKRCAEELGFRAIKLQPQYQGLNAASERGEFFFETASTHKLPVIAHTGAGAPLSLPSLFIVPAKKFPKLPVILAHAGGSAYVLEAIVAAGVCPNIYLELSSLMPHHVLDVLLQVPSQRLMIGSDLPESVHTEMDKIVTLDIDDQMKQDILWNTAESVFDGKR
jgi:predicted TIM-barrel fold metal-dependent hydrolase